MGTTHAAAVKAEISKAASGLHRTVQANGHRPVREGPDSNSWSKADGGQTLSPAGSGMKVNLADLLVTKG